MEVEHINDDTIRVTINHEDLAERGVTVLDLLGNQQHIQQFFYSILDEVDVDESFKDTDAVTFQVMPKRNGMELFITKGAQLDDELIELLDDDILQELKKELKLEKKSHASESQKLAESMRNKDDKMADIKSFVLMFDNIEQVIMLARDISQEYIESTLYKESGHYYLVIAFKEHIEECPFRNRQKFNLKTIATEYGQLSRLSPDVLTEYAMPIIETNALGQLVDYFK